MARMSTPLAHNDSRLFLIRECCAGKPVTFLRPGISSSQLVRMEALPMRSGRQAAAADYLRGERADRVVPARQAAVVDRRNGDRASGFAPGQPARRALNVFVAAVLLVLSLPLMVVIGVLIKITSPGPVFFIQTRIGVDRRNGKRVPVEACQRRFDQGGRPFRIYKFRTMCEDTASAERQVWALPDDPRVTPIGRLLRKFRMDELPQLFNILRGEMNLVGPRPEQPKIFVALRGEVDRYAQRQRVRPGITGLAQVRWRYDSSVEDVHTKLDFDLQYIQNESVWQDLRIMLETVPVVVFQRGSH
jgi:lipopolysaccharide/colanic/teichoic acid biosynthesis glycosyltransferase